MLLHVIADYGNGDLAFAEVVQRIKRHLPEAEPMITPVPMFSTLAAGLSVAQLGLNAAPSDTLIYHNVAPREDTRAARSSNAGERLAYARLPGGVRVIGVNAGHAFSFVREAAEELRWVAAPAAGSQFRSRDLFPGLLGALAKDEDVLAEELEMCDIPAVPPNRMAYVDGYGNIKTTIERGEIESRKGTPLHIRIGQIEQKATLSEEAFAVEPGQLAFAPGSSGWKGPDGRTIQWMELFLRGGNAWESFNRPPIGATIAYSL